MTKGNQRYRPLAGATIALTGAVFASPAAVVAQESDTSDLEALVNASATIPGAIALARSQAQQGDLTGAAATLERALLADPNAHDARLFYAGLMCRLDDRQGARVEVAKLAGQNFSDDAWNEAASACGGVLDRPAAPAAGPSTGISGEVSIGLAFDSDALGPLVAQLDLPVIGVRRDEGLSWIGSARIGGKGKNYFDGGDVYGGVSVRSKRDLDGPKQSYDLAEVRLGYGRQAEGSDFAIGGVVRHARLFNDPYVTEYGVQGEVGTAHTEESRIVFRAEAAYQNYARVGPARSGDGWRFDLFGQLEKKLGEGKWLLLGAGLEAKDGRVKDFGYLGTRIYAAYRAPLGDKGAYFNLGSTLRFVNFFNKPPFQDRKDVRLFTRAAYGHPIIADKLILEGAATYTLRGVKDVATTVPVAFNISNYRSVGAEMRLIWKFGK